MSQPAQGGGSSARSASRYLGVWGVGSVSVRTVVEYGASRIEEDAIVAHDNHSGDRWAIGVPATQREVGGNLYVDKSSCLLGAYRQPCMYSQACLLGSIGHIAGHVK